MPSPPPAGKNEEAQRPAAAPQAAPDPANPPEKPSRDWIRKAQSRRLKANAQDAAAEVYAPKFAARREADWAPDFDRPATPPPAEEADKTTPPAEPDAQRNWMTLLAAAVGLVLATAIAVLLWHRNHFDTNRRDKNAQLENAPENASQKRAEKLAAAVPASKKVVEQFLAATTPEEKAPFVRGGPAMLPAMRDYYATHLDEPLLHRLASNVEFLSGNDDSREFIQITGTMTGGAVFETVVEQTPAGPLLDWRYLIATGEMDWNTWRAARPERPILHRVIAKLDDYYTGDYHDSAIWLCVRLSDPAGFQFVWAYARRDEPLGVTLLRGLSGIPTPVKLQATLYFPSKARDGTAGDQSGIPQALFHSIGDKGWIDHSPEANTPVTTEKP